MRALVVLSAGFAECGEAGRARQAELLRVCRAAGPRLIGPNRFAGGVLVEVLKDVAVRLTPLAPADADEMVRALRSYPLLEGFRGAPPADVAALPDVLLRVVALADDLPQVVELDLNPVLVHERGASVLDARIRVAPAAPPTPRGAAPAASDAGR